MEIVLREYQKICVDLALAAYERNPTGQELLVLPTGSGKTVIFCQVIDSLNKQHGLNTLIIAHRDELLDQAADKYRMIKPNAIIGKVGSGRHEYGGEVTCASIATISRPEHIKRLKAIGYGLIIVDEAHHIAADGYQRVIEALPEAFVLMVTATPDRLDGKKIIEKPPLYKATIVDMILDKYLCNVQVVGISTETSLNDVHTEMGDYKVGELADAVDTPIRNQCVVNGYLKHASGRRAICFAVTVAHAVNLCNVFNRVGVPAAVVSGETPLDERKQMYHDFHAGTIKILCSVQVLTEGFDEPLVECVVMARPTKSRSLYLQSVGRGLRLAPGKKECVVVDITDNSEKYGLQPQTLQSAFDKNIKNGETVLDAEERENQEERKRDTTRKLNNTRTHDVAINVVVQLDWQLRDDGKYVMEVGPEKHRIALVPVADEGYDLWGHVGYYKVLAKLAPHYDAQVWSNPLPLDFAQSEAEKKARLLLADPKNVKLVDRTDPWRDRPISEKQIDQITKYKAKGWIKAPVPVDEDGNFQLTRGQASDLLDPVFEMFKRWDAKREAKKGVAV